jgi:hypothetical protein
VDDDRDARMPVGRATGGADRGVDVETPPGAGGAQDLGRDLRRGVTDRRAAGCQRGRERGGVPGRGRLPRLRSRARDDDRHRERGGRERPEQDDPEDQGQPRPQRHTHPLATADPGRRSLLSERRADASATDARREGPS